MSKWAIQVPVSWGSAQKVAAFASERDAAKQQVLQLRQDRLLERAFSHAEGCNGGDARGTFFEIFKGRQSASTRPRVSITSGNSSRPIRGTNPTSTRALKAPSRASALRAAMVPTRKGPRAVIRRPKL